MQRWSIEQVIILPSILGGVCVLWTLRLWLGPTSRVLMSLRKDYRIRAAAAGEWPLPCLLGLLVAELLKPAPISHTGLTVRGSIAIVALFGGLAVSAILGNIVTLRGGARWLVPRAYQDQWDPQIAASIPSLSDVGEDFVGVIIRRVRTRVDRFKKYVVVVDGAQVGSIKNGAVKSIALGSGKHLIQVVRSGQPSGPVRSVDISSGAVQLVCRPNWWDGDGLSSLASVREHPESAIVLEDASGETDPT